VKESWWWQQQRPKHVMIHTFYRVQLLVQYIHLDTTLIHGHIKAAIVSVAQWTSGELQRLGIYDLLYAPYAKSTAKLGSMDRNFQTVVLSGSFSIPFVSHRLPKWPYVRLALRSTISLRYWWKCSLMSCCNTHNLIVILSLLLHGKAWRCFHEDSTHWWLPEAPIVCNTL
jgi:hypothetical protein